MLFKVQLSSTGLHAPLQLLHFTPRPKNILQLCCLILSTATMERGTLGSQETAGESADPENPMVKQNRAGACRNSGVIIAKSLISCKTHDFWGAPFSPCLNGIFPIRCPSKRRMGFCLLAAPHLCTAQSPVTAIMVTKSGKSGTLHYANFASWKEMFY